MRCSSRCQGAAHIGGGTTAAHLHEVSEGTRNLVVQVAQRLVLRQQPLELHCMAGLELGRVVLARRDGSIIGRQCRAWCAEAPVQALHQGNSDPFFISDAPPAIRGSLLSGPG